MHRGHDHHDHGEMGGHAHPAHAPVGHNGAPRAAQWQTPHVPDGDPQPPGKAPSEPDLDLVEAAFVEGFAATSDPTSFLRLARVKFEGIAADGARLALLRVEVERVTDVGSLSPRLQGGFGYDPLPARLVSSRKRLSFVYFDGAAPRHLDLAEATALGDA